MTRFLFAFLILASSPVIAKDDGGFGSVRFTAQAPEALSDQSVEDKSIALDETPANIEPAAGDNKDANQPTTEQSNHQAEPYTIQKDLEIR